MICLHWQSLQIILSGGTAGARASARALLAGAVWGNGGFCWQLRGPSPSCRGAAGGGWRAHVKASAGFGRLGAADLPPETRARTRVYSARRRWLFLLCFPPRLPLCQLHKIIHKYVIPQKLDGAVVSRKTAILNSLEKRVIDSIFK